MSEPLLNVSPVEAMRVVFPESSAAPVIRAAHRAYLEGTCAPQFIGDPDVIAQACRDAGVAGTGWYTASAPEASGDLVAAMRDTGISDDVATYLLGEPLYFASALVAVGRADALVAGYVHESGEVIGAAGMVIGLEEGVDSPSSFFLMDIPGFEGPEGSRLVYADCGLTIEPTEDELASIAILSARSARRLLGWEPRVAMLSFSTKGSGEHERTERLVRVVEEVRRREPGLLIDGELQVDAALVPEVAAKKVSGDSPVAGRANVLVFPSLEAGNIAYKLTQRLAGARAYGPILQGFRRTVCDLSRGASEEDILGVIRIAVSLASDGRA